MSPGVIQFYRLVYIASMTFEFDENVDYYKILGVSVTATAEEIKQNHIALALKYHPDVNKNTTKAAEQFRDIQNAYNVLSKPENRASYDYARKTALYGRSSDGASMNRSYTGDGGGSAFFDTQRIQFRETQRTGKRTLSVKFDENELLLHLFMNAKPLRIGGS